MSTLPFSSSPPGSPPPPAPVDVLMYFGIACVILGQFVGSTGLLLMKRAAERDADRPFYRRPLWMMGLLTFLTNSIGLDAFIYATTPLTLVAPLTALGVILTAVLANIGFLVEKDHTPPLGWFSMLMIVGGVSLAALMAAVPQEKQPTLADMCIAALQTPFLSYAIPGLVVTLTCLLCIRLQPLPKRHPIMTLLTGIAAAFCGSLSVLGFKALAISIRLAIEGNSQLLDPTFYAVILLPATLGPLNMALMNRTLEFSASAFGMPLYQSLLILATILAGGTLYGDFGRMGEYNLLRFSAGVAVLLIGMFGLSFAARRSAGAEGAGSEYLTAGSHLAIATEGEEPPLPVTEEDVAVATALSNGLQKPLIQSVSNSDYP